MSPFKTFRNIFAFAAAFLACASADAQLFRAYLSLTGSDANSCTVVAPCRLLPAALAAVADGGEIWMLNSANYNTSTVNVTKSVSILAIPGAVGSVVATLGGNGMTINGAGIRVTLRNLVFIRLGSGQDAISFQAGAELNIRDCEIQGVQGHGIHAEAEAVDAKLNVSNVVIRDAGSSGVHLIAGVATLDRVQVTGSEEGIFVEVAARMSVTDSVFSGNVSGVLILNGDGTLRVTIDRSVITGNSYGVFLQGNTGPANVTLTRSTISHNSVAGIDALQVMPQTATAVVGANVIAENAIAFRFAGGATIYTRGDNTLRFNGTDFSGGTLTALPPI